MLSPLAARADTGSLRPDGNAYPSLAPESTSVAYNWTGPYIGVNAGGGFGNGAIEDKDCFECASDIFHKAFGEVGGQVGYNWQFGSAVLGIEGDMNWANLYHRGSLWGPSKTSMDLDRFASLRARAGVALNHSLLYVTAGPALGHMENAFTYYNNTPNDTWRDNGWRWGMALGPGFEYMLSPNWSLKGEYLFLDFANKVADSEPFTTCGGNPCQMGFPLSAQVARLGLNYKFSGFAEPPSANAHEVTFVADWSGPYAGINSGGGMGDGTIEDKDCWSCSNDSFHKGFAETGGQIGYNWQFDSTVLGLEGDMNWASLYHKGSLWGSSKTSMGLDAFASFRGRAGLALNRSLLYVTAGPVLGHVYNAFTYYGNTPNDTWRDNGWHWGMAAGPGLEYLLGPNLSLKAEYLFLDFADKTAHLEPSSDCGSGRECRMGFPLTAQVARLGLNYKFDGWKPPSFMSGNAAPSKTSPDYKWTGFYIGVNAGGGMGNGTVDDKDCYWCASDTFHKALGEAGGQLGYNWQFGSAVLGIEGDMNWSSLNHEGFIGLDDGNIPGKDGLKLDAFASLRARAGLAAGRGLFYLSAGPALGHVDGFAKSYANNTFTTQTASWKDMAWHWGLAAGPGMEFALGPHWSIRGEYLFMDFADKPVDAQPSISCGGTPCRLGFPLTAQVARLGLNYKFD